MTLGGYDSSRIIPNDVSFSRHGAVLRDLVVSLQSITAYPKNGSVIPLLSQPIETLIESSVTNVWLPADACQAFERTFGLVWNSKYDAYLVDEKVHEDLLQANYNITFRLAETKDSLITVDISLPYSSFDLALDYPLVPANMSGTRYFPLRTAVNESQFTLGRTFLQEA